MKSLEHAVLGDVQEGCVWDDDGMAGLAGPAEIALDDVAEEENHEIFFRVLKRYPSRQKLLQLPQVVSARVWPEDILISMHKARRLAADEVAYSIALEPDGVNKAHILSDMTSAIGDISENLLQWRHSESLQHALGDIMAAIVDDLVLAKDLGLRQTKELRNTRCTKEEH